MSEYDAYPEHPLHGINPEILTAAREAMFEIAAFEEWNAQPEVVISMADAIIMSLLPWLDTTMPYDPWCGCTERDYCRQSGGCFCTWEGDVKGKTRLIERSPRCRHHKTLKAS